MPVHFAIACNSSGRSTLNASCQFSSLSISIACLTMVVAFCYTFKVSRQSNTIGKQTASAGHSVGTSQRRREGQRCRCAYASVASADYLSQRRWVAASLVTSLRLAGWLAGCTQSPIVKTGTLTSRKSTVAIVKLVDDDLSLDTPAAAGRGWCFAAACWRG